MRIGVIGAGSVGKTLGLRWHKAGHEVSFGVRNPADAKYDSVRRFGVDIETIDAAARRAEIVVLATPWTATEDAIRACGGLTGKIVVDCTNPLKPNLAGLTHGADDSGAEQVARWAEGAKVIKAFNTVGYNIMDMPEMEDRRAVMFICGDDEGKTRIKQLSDELGFETVDAGPLAGARLLEPFALLWITAAYKLGLGRGFAFSLIRSRAG